MAEPFATSEPEEAASETEASAPKERFEHAAPAPVAEAGLEAAVAVEAAPVEPESVETAPVETAPVETPPAEPVQAQIPVEPAKPARPAKPEKPAAPAARAEEDAPAASSAPEWPLSWLRLVEPEPPEPDEAAVAAVLAAEAADAEGVAHAFGQTMAAALDPEPEPEPAAESDVEAEAHTARERTEFAAANDAAAAEPVRLRTARPRRVSVEPGPAPAAGEEPPATEAEPLRFTPRPQGAPRPFARRNTRVDPEIAEQRAGEGGVAAMVYLLYLAGFLLVPAIAGFLLALNARKAAPDWLESHYVFQIRTFWIGLVGVAISGVLLLSGVLTLLGLVLGLLLVVWLLARSALGFISVVKLRPYPRPHAWLA